MVENKIFQLIKKIPFERNFILVPLGDVLENQKVASADEIKYITAGKIRLNSAKSNKSNKSDKKIQGKLVFFTIDPEVSLEVVDWLKIHKVYIML